MYKKLKIIQSSIFSKFELARVAPVLHFRAVAARGKRQPGSRAKEQEHTPRQLGYFLEFVEF